MNSEYLDIPPGGRSQNSDAHGKVYFLLLCRPQEATCSAQTEFLWITVFEASLELTLRYLASSRQNKEDLQGFLDCKLGNPVPQSNVF